MFKQYEPSFGSKRPKDAFAYSGPYVVSSVWGNKVKFFTPTGEEIEASHTMLKPYFGVADHGPIADTEILEKPVAATGSLGVDSDVDIDGEISSSGPSTGGGDGPYSNAEEDGKIHEDAKEDEDMSRRRQPTRRATRRDYVQQTPHDDAIFGLLHEMIQAILRFSGGG